MFITDGLPQDNYEEPSRFLVLYTVTLEIGEHNLGVVYNQKLHRTTMTLGTEDIIFVTPVKNCALWYPLKTVLGNRISMVHWKCYGVSR